MIRKYYSHVVTRQLANKLVGKNFAKLKEEKKKQLEKEKAMQLIRDAE
jgi:hypothetical protein